MFCKLSLLAVVAPLVSALTLQIPQNPTSGGSITIFWSSASTDPTTWSFELTNTAFNDAFAIANNVNPTAGNLTLTLPIVPVGDGYTLEAVNIGNITDVFASTSDFAIGAATSSSSTPSSTSSGTSSAKSGTASSATSTVTTPLTSTSGSSSNIVTSSQTTPATSSTGNSSTPSSTPFAGALSSRLDLGSSVGGIAAVILSAVAGAAIIAF